MRRFRHSLKDQDHSQLDPFYDSKQVKDELHLLTLLDNCTQIYRDDRIWLRNKVKDNHQEVVGILKAAVKGAHRQLSMVNLKQLQISLRKYIAKIKERQREDQLIRFKENVLIKDFKNKNRSIEDFSVFSSQSRNQDRHREGYSLPRQPSLLSRIQEPIEEEESSDKESSYLSRASETRHPYQKDLGHSNSQHKNLGRIGQSRRSSRQGRSIEGGVQRDASTPLKQSRSNNALNNRSVKPTHPNKDVPKRNALSNIKVDTYSQKEELLTFKPSSATSVKPTPTKQPDVLLSAQVSAAMETPAGHSRIGYLSSSIKPRQTTQSLFTSPELLMECRMFIQRNSNLRRDLAIDSRISVPVTQVMVPAGRSSGQVSRYEEELQPNGQMPLGEPSIVSSEIQLSSNGSRLRISIEDQMAEDIFDNLVCTQPTISNFHEVLLSKYQHSPTLKNIIARSANQISCEELGSLLEVYCQSRGNPVRELYNYIDLDQNGHFTLEDLRAFLGQVVESEKDPMYCLALRIFQLSQKEDRVQYWNLYQIKESQEMRQFLKYLGQFEFEVEA